jgi:glycosyltransferase involved in cell wall biosynthesis
VFFPEYCTKENLNFRKNIAYDKKRVKLVMAGTLTPTSEPELVDAKSFYKKMKELTECKVEVNVVLLKKFYDMVFTQERYKDYLYEHTFNDYFKIHLGAEMDPSVLKGYDFGIFSDTFYDYELKKYSEHYKYAVISRVVLYLEAGLPIVVNRAMSSLSKIVEDNNIGIVFEDEDVKHFDEILDISQKEYEILVENVYRFREDFSYNDITMKPIMEMLNE